MKVPRLLPILLCISIQSGEPEVFRFFSDEDRIDWNEYELKISRKDKEMYAGKLPKLFDYFFNPESENHTQDDFIRNLHFMDLNNDRLIDIIYEGWGGGESDRVIIFLNENNKGFKKVFDDFQFVESLEIINGRLSSITILDFGCCAEYVEYETKYKLNDNFDKSISYQRAKPNYVQAPKTLFKQPKQFVTMNDEYTLRSSPVINDTATFIYDAVGKGNVIAKYPKNSKGMAWAEERDKEGRIWWLVEMYPVEKLNENLIYYKDSIPVREIGWMSSRYVLVQEN